MSDGWRQIRGKKSLVPTWLPQIISSSMTRKGNALIIRRARLHNPTVGLKFLKLIIVQAIFYLRTSGDWW